MASRDVSHEGLAEVLQLALERKRPHPTRQCEVVLISSRRGTKRENGYPETFQDQLFNHDGYNDPGMNAHPYSLLTFARRGVASAPIPPRDEVFRQALPSCAEIRTRHLYPQYSYMFIRLSLRLSPCLHKRILCGGSMVFSNRKERLLICLVWVHHQCLQRGPNTEPAHLASAKFPSLSNGQ